MSTELNRCTIYLTPEIVENLDETAKTLNVSRSEVVRIIMNKYFFSPQKMEIIPAMVSPKKLRENMGFIKFLKNKLIDYNESKARGYSKLNHYE